MKKFQWIVYGLDMFGYVIVEMEGNDMRDSMMKTIEIVKENNIDFDTIEPFDKSFVKRVGWLEI